MRQFPCSKVVQGVATVGMAQEATPSVYVCYMANSSSSVEFLYMATTSVGFLYMANPSVKFILHGNLFCRISYAKK